MRRAGSVSRLRVCCGGTDEAQEIRAGSGEFEGMQSKDQPATNGSPLNAAIIYVYI